jgi:hypothetical protein
MSKVSLDRVSATHYVRSQFKKKLLSIRFKSFFYFALGIRLENKFCASTTAGIWLGSGVGRRPKLSLVEGLALLQR